MIDEFNDETSSESGIEEPSSRLDVEPAEVTGPERNDHPPNVDRHAQEDEDREDGRNDLERMLEDLKRKQSESPRLEGTKM